MVRLLSPLLVLASILLVSGMNFNVNALSTAIAVALQQAAQMSPQVSVDNVDQPAVSGSVSVSQTAGRGFRGEGESSSSLSHSAAGGSQEIVTMPSPGTGTEL